MRCENEWRNGELRTKRIYAPHWNKWLHKKHQNTEKKVQIINSTRWKKEESRCAIIAGRTGTFAAIYLCALVSTCDINTTWIFYRMSRARVYFHSFIFMLLFPASFFPHVLPLFLFFDVNYENKSGIHRRMLCLPNKKAGKCLKIRWKLNADIATFGIFITIMCRL